MPFDQTPITGVTALASDADLLVSWRSTAPAGTQYQLYLDRVLAWHGTATSVLVPYPDGPVAIAVGAVAAGEETTDFSAGLPQPWQDHARLTWRGGRYEAPDLAAFRIYASAGPSRGFGSGGFGLGGYGVGGGSPAVDYAAPVATVAAYPGGIVADGFGSGGWGYGGWGEANGSYSWRSGPLAAGTWAFGVKPVDVAGNEGVAEEATVLIVAPPQEVPPGPGGQRLWVESYNPATRVAVLAWLASPG